MPKLEKYGFHSQDHQFLSTYGQLCLEVLVMRAKVRDFLEPSTRRQRRLA